MENINYSDCSNELAVKLLGRLSLDMGLDLPKQLELRRIIEETIYNYSITPKETALVTSDLEAKVNLFLVTKKLEGLAESTLKEYRGRLIKLAMFFNKPLISITSGDMKMFVYSNTQNMMPSSINTMMIPIRLFFKWAQNEELIVKDPCANIKAMKCEKRLRKALTKAQMEIIRDKINLIPNKKKSIKYKALVEFLVSTACRVDEVVNVKISDLDMNNLTLLIIGKGNKQRRVYFTERCKLAITNYLNTRTDNDPYLFVKSKKPHTQLSTRGIQAMIEEVKKISGLNVDMYPHIFRHTFATHSLKGGMRIEILQAILGHENPATTQIYARLCDDDVQHTYRQIVG